MPVDVAQAVAAIHRFGHPNLSRFGVRQLLDLWRHSADLGAADAASVPTVVLGLRMRAVRAGTVPTVEPLTGDVVARAAYAERELIEFGGLHLSRIEARQLLGLWRHGPDLDQATCDAVVDVIRPRPAPPSLGPGEGCDNPTPIHSHWCGFCFAGRLFSREECRTLPSPPVCRFCGCVDWRSEDEAMASYRYRVLGGAEPHESGQAHH